MLPVGVHVVPRVTLAAAPEIARSPAVLVGVVDVLARTLGLERGEGLRRAADVRVEGAPLGGPVDVLRASAADGTNVPRDLLLEQEHVTRDAALGGGLPDDRGTREARLGAGCGGGVAPHTHHLPLSLLL